MATNNAEWRGDTALYTDHTSLTDTDSCMAKCFDDIKCNSAEWIFTAAVVAKAAVPPAAEILAKAETKTCRLWNKGGLTGTGIAALNSADTYTTYHKKSDLTAIILGKFNQSAGQCKAVAADRTGNTAFVIIGSIESSESCLNECDSMKACKSAEWNYTPKVAAHADPNNAAT